MNRVLVGLGLVVLAIALVLPAVAIPYFVSLGLSVAMFTALAQSWNLISGFTGYVSFGHVAFFGTGAYTAAILIVRLQWYWIPAALLGGLTAVLLALVIGLPCLRLKGPYFAIAMLGLSQVLRIVVLLWDSMTQGGSGIYLPPAKAITPYYYGMVTVALVTSGVAALVARSQFGLRLLAIREDEVAAEAVGINAPRHKILAFLLSALPSGIVGGIYAPYVAFLEPLSTFETLITIQMIVMTMLGGRATAAGPVLGAVFLTLAGEFVWARFPFVHQALFGVLILTVVLWMPNGVIGVLRDRGWLPARA
jgi:branched-chain amino acid transport system permease protein